MRRAASVAVVGTALALGVAAGAAAQTKPKPRPGQQPSTSQTQCGAYGGGIHCNGGSSAQQFGSQRVREFGVAGAGFAQNFAARAANATAEAGGAAPAPVYSGRRHRITTYSDGSSATTTQYGRHSVTVYSDGRVLRCQLFGAQRICN